jgi:hypothetical protein
VDLQRVKDRIVYQHLSAIYKLYKFPNCDPFIEKLMILKCEVEVLLEDTDIATNITINKVFESVGHLLYTSLSLTFL